MFKKLSPGADSLWDVPSSISGRYIRPIFWAWNSLSHPSIQKNPYPSSFTHWPASLHGWIVVWTFEPHWTYCYYFTSPILKHSGYKSAVPRTSLVYSTTYSIRSSLYNITTLQHYHFTTLLLYNITTHGLVHEKSTRFAPQGTLSNVRLSPLSTSNEEVRARPLLLHSPFAAPHSLSHSKVIRQHLLSLTLISWSVNSEAKI